MLNTSRIETTGIIATLFGVGSFALLIPNPLMPASVAHSHLWETLLSDLLLGAIVDGRWLQTRSPPDRAKRRPCQGSS
jgi:hypothetical protein